MEKDELKRICLVVSSTLTAKAFLLDYIRVLSKKYQLIMVANTDNCDFLANLGIDVEVKPIRIERKIYPLRDVAALYALYRLFRKKKFDLVHSVSPKAGLLAMLAAALARVPARVHTFTGQVWATRKGVSRFLLKNVDRLLVLFATHILIDSNSQRSFLLMEKVVPGNKSTVLAKGSISGVDTQRFRPQLEARKKIRDVKKIKKDDIVFLYVGRLKQDKGLIDLAQAFAALCNSSEGQHLLLVGPDEEGMRDRIKAICQPCANRLHFVDYTLVPEQYLSAADIFCLPSYREGFGTTIIEAGAVGIPAIGSRIYGITDAVDEGRTGLLYEPGNVPQLIGLMKKLAQDKSLRKKMGENARARVIRDFSKERLTAELLDYYKAVIN